jgi:gliding motility-associated-like protein
MLFYSQIISGALDNAFGINGRVTTNIKLWNYANCITVKDSRIYVAGASTNDQFGAQQQFTIAAYKNCFAPTVVNNSLPVALCKGSSFMGNVIVKDTTISDTLKSTCLYDSAINVYHITISNADTVVNKSITVCYGALYKGTNVYSSFFETDTVLAPHSCGTRKFINKTQVTVTPKIKNSFGKDTVLCNNGNIRLAAQQPALSYLWQDNSNNAQYTVSTPGLYWVEVTDTFKCTARDSVTVRASDLYLSITPDTAALPGQAILLVPQTNGIVTWTADPTLSCSICQSALASPLVTTTYALSATKNGCALNAIVKVIVGQSVYLYIPKAFTPNKDSRNDIFKVSTNIAGPFVMQIFNRYGERVFTTTNTTTGWDGRYKDKEQPNGVYIYTIQYQETASAVPKQLKGEIVLIR